MSEVSDRQMGWQRAEATREACKAYEQRQVTLCKQLFAACQESSDPRVREHVAKVLETEAFIRFMGGSSELKNIIGRSTPKNGI